MKKHITTSVIILVIISVLSFSSCNHTNNLFESVVSEIRNDYIKQEKYNIGDNFVYRKFYYSEESITKYSTDGKYLDVTESNIDYIKKWIERFKTDISDNDSKGKMDFDVDNQIKIGDKWFIQLSSLGSGLSVFPRPEYELYEGIKVTYVSFDDNCVYSFYKSGAELEELSDGPIIKIRNEGEDNNAIIVHLFDKSIESMIYFAKKETNLNHYYSLTNKNDDSIENYYVFYDGITLNYDFDDFTDVAICYLDSTARNWDEDAFFKYYSDFFGNHDVSYFDYCGKNYMKIKLNNTVFFFWVEDNDYIIFAWENYSRIWKEPNIEQIEIERVEW